MKDKGIREHMFQEMADKSIFNQVMEYAFDYADKAMDRQVFPTPASIEAMKTFNEDMPALPGNSAEIIDMLHKYGSPATVSQIGGRYFGFVNGGVIPAALAAKWLSDFWDQNTPLHFTSPIASKLEAIVEKWLQQLFNLPDETVAGFVSGSSMANLCGLAAARFRIYQRLGWDINAKGLMGAPKIRIVAGKHAHGTVLKAIALLGLGKDNIEWVDVDEQGRIIAGKIPTLDSQTILILQAGNVNSGAFDPFEEICPKAIETGAWIHIDGAFGLWAKCSEKLKHLANGIEWANSWAVDGHKTLNTPYDCGIVLCNDSEALVSALQASGSYILYGENRDGMLYTPEMSRRARIVELWASLKYLGKAGIDDLVYGLHERAVQFSNELKAAGFEVLNEVVFNQVMVAFENDDITGKTLDLIQKSGECWCGGAVWNNRKIIRISICSWATTPPDVSRSVKAFINAYNEAKKL